MSLADDRLRCAHLLRRFGLGASESEVDYYFADGLNGAIDRLLEYSNVDEGFNLDVERLKNDKGRIAPGVVSTWWVARLLVTRRPLQERMTLFWHDHFATSGSKVNAGRVMYHQNEVLRQNATGNFRKLLSDVSKDPAMILWLDNQQNVRGHANENFAREVMELFTLGIGHYTEKDVQEGARAFTGWSLDRPAGKNGAAEFLFRPGRHDIGRKTYLGSSGNFNGDDVLNILCDQPRTAEYLVTKIWDWFVWPNPDPKTVAPFIAKFRESGLDIKLLLREIMRSDEFYSSKAMRAVVKSPVDFCVVTLRALGVGEQVKAMIQNATEDIVPRRTLAPAAIANQSMKAMGMWLLYPPDVHGWDNGKGWISTQTMVQRIGWAERVFGKGGGDRGPLRYPAWELFKANPATDGVVHKLLSVFDTTLTPAHRKVLTQAAQRVCGSAVTEDTANATASAVTRLIFATPEFQMS